jgi:hypothetical protein
MVSMTTSGTQNATTEWEYEAARGYLLNKEYDDGKKMVYTYTTAGRLKTRSWARGVTTTYYYDFEGEDAGQGTNADAGDLARIDYSDSTPNISYKYHRWGGAHLVTDVTGVRELTYRESLDLALETEEISSLTATQQEVAIPRTMTYTYDVLGRRTSRALGDGTTYDHATLIGFDGQTGRLKSITHGNPFLGFTPKTFSQSYVANSNLVDDLTAPAHTVSNAWESHRNVLRSKTHDDRATTPNALSSITYGSLAAGSDAVNAIGQRLEAHRTLQGASLDQEEWGYNGNGEDSFDSLLSPATAKNVLTVGSIEDQAGPNIFFSNFSGAGPTDDGRIKPDLVAVGQRNPDLNLGNSLFEANRNNNFSYYNGLTNVNGTINLDGTSFAAPSVTGGLMLAEERRQELFPTASPLLASTWRAAAIHTVSALGNGGPNYRSGWGIFNAVNIVQLLEDEESVGRGSLMKEFTINSGASKTFYVTVPSNTQAGFTLAWSDPAGSPPAFGTIVDDDTAMLVNDLDLVVIDEVANLVTTYFPWTLNPDLVGEDPALRGAPAVRTSTDNRNNVEKVTVDASAQERRLKITVSANGALQGGSQKVSLILSGVQLDDPQITGSGFTQNPNNADEFSVTVSTDPGAFYTLETSFNLENGSWSDVATFKAEDSTTTVLTNRNSAQSKQFWRVRRGE